MANRTNNVLKNNPQAAAELGRRNKGNKQKRTIVKEKITKTFEEEAAEAIERNMREFLNSPDEKVRQTATEKFAEFIKPKKRELSGQISHPIVLVMHSDLMPGEEIEDSKGEENE